MLPQPPKAHLPLSAIINRYHPVPQSTLNP
jgi:hypothetical protein